MLTDSGLVHGLRTYAWTKEKSLQLPCEGQAYKKSDVQGTPVEVVTLQAYKLSPSFFAERMRGVSADMSRDIFSRLQGIKVIDAAGYCQWKKCDVPHSCW